MRDMGVGSCVEGVPVLVYQFGLLCNHLLLLGSILSRDRTTLYTSQVNRYRVCLVRVVVGTYSMLTMNLLRVIINVIDLLLYDLWVYLGLYL